MWAVEDEIKRDALDAPESTGDDQGRRLFALRLNALCDDAGIPPKGKNRQKTVGDLFGVGQKGARKWLEAESLPTLTKCIAIAQHFGVYVEWLLAGRGPRKVPINLDPHLDGDIIELARRIKEMPDDHRKLLMKIFESGVQDDDPRLGKWSAAAKPQSRRRI